MPINSMTPKEIDEVYSELIHTIAKQWASTNEKKYMDALIITLRDYVHFKEAEDYLNRIEFGKQHES